MELLSIVAIGLISGLTVSALILYLCYHLCSRKKRPRWQSKILPTPYEEYIPMIPPPKPTSVVVSNVQPPAHPDGTTTETRLSPVPEMPDSTHPTLRPPLESRSSEQELLLDRRYQQGKVAELELGLLFRGNGLEMTIRKIEKIHSSINKQHAYVRIKNPRERKISIPTLQYSKSFQALLGAHSFRFNLTLHQLQSIVFRFYLWSVDAHSRQREFGEFTLDFKDMLAGRDLKEGIIEKYDFFVYDTQPRELDPSIKLKLKYHFKSAKLIVTVLEIRDLQHSPWALIPTGIYVKIVFTNSLTGHVWAYKTKHIQGAHPQFHTTFNHPLLKAELPNITMTVQIKARIVHTETLCVLELSSNSTGRLGEHWIQMIQGISGGYGVEMSHRISQEKRGVNPFARRTSTTAFY